MSAAAWSVPAETAYVDDGVRVVAISLTDLAECRPHVLEGTAASIWRALSAGQEDAIIAAVAEEYGTDGADVAEEIRAFLVQLATTGLIVQIA